MCIHSCINLINLLYLFFSFIFLPINYVIWSSWLIWSCTKWTWFIYLFRFYWFIRFYIILFKLIIIWFNIVSWGMCLPGIKYIGLKIINTLKKFVIFFNYINWLISWNYLIMWYLLRHFFILCFVTINLIWFNFCILHIY